MKFNLNEHVRVQLTDFGRAMHRKRWDDFRKERPWLKDKDYQPPVEDKNGWSTWQLWILMREFGPVISLGASEFPFDLDIEIPSGRRLKSNGTPKTRAAA
jgi:hypothetical protein